MSKQMTKGRAKKAGQLVQWQLKDAGARTIIVNVLTSHDVSDLQTLAISKPKVFDELFDIVGDLLDQMPDENDPGFVTSRSPGGF